jgi:hypothetical protein
MITRKGLPALHQYIGSTILRYDISFSSRTFTFTFQLIFRHLREIDFMYLEEGNIFFKKYYYLIDLLLDYLPLAFFFLLVVGLQITFLNCLQHFNKSFPIILCRVFAPLSRVATSLPPWQRSLSHTPKTDSVSLKVRRCANPDCVRQLEYCLLRSIFLLNLLSLLNMPV